MITQKITLNTCEINHVIIYANEGEVRCRYVEVLFKDDETNDVNLNGYDVTFYAKKPDGTSIFNSCTVDTVNNTATAELTSQTLSVSGILDCEFQIFNSSGVVLKVGGLKIAVAPEKGFSGAIESTDEFNVLTSAIYEARSFSNSIGSLENLSTTEKSTVVGAINEVNEKVIPVSQGGTGAQSKIGARTNLEVRKEYSLYSNSSGTNGTITLSDNYSNYDVIKVLFGDNNVHSVFSFYPSVAYRTPLSTLYTYSNLAGLYFHGSFLSFSDKTATFSRQGLSDFTSSGTSTMSSTDLKVYKILGYKY